MAPGANFKHLLKFGIYGELVCLISMCMPEKSCIVLPINVLLTENVSFFCFLLESQSNMVSPKFLSFMFLLNYAITMHV